MCVGLQLPHRSDGSFSSRIPLGYLFACGGKRWMTGGLGLDLRKPGLPRRLTARRQREIKKRRDRIECNLTQMVGAKRRQCIDLGLLVTHDLAPSRGALLGWLQWRRWQIELADLVERQRDAVHLDLEIGVT